MKTDVQPETSSRSKLPNTEEESIPLIDELCNQRAILKSITPGALAWHEKAQYELFFSVPQPPVARADGSPINPRAVF